VIKPRKVGQSMDEKLGNLAPHRFTLAVICGKNEAARASVRSLRLPPTISLHAMGFVSNMHEWMDAADLLVSKSGGLTSSEALAKRLPMIVVDPIPGQEMRNADFLIQQGIGIRVHDVDDIGEEVEVLLRSPERLAAMREAALAHAKPYASRDIARLILGKPGQQAPVTQSRWTPELTERLPEAKHV